MRMRPLLASIGCNRGCFGDNSVGPERIFTCVQGMLQEGKETVARLNSRIQGMTASDCGVGSGPGSPASQSTAVPGLTPSPALSVLV